MTDNTQPEALRLADWLQAAVQIYPQRSEDDPGGYASEVDQVMDEAASELRRQHTELETLRTGYEAARLEIESLRHDLENARHNLRVSQASFRRAVDERDALIEQHGSSGGYPALPVAPHKIGDINLWPESLMRAFADATCAIRASHGQAPAMADMQDAYVGAREDLAIWKRRALEAERDLRAERETASRLAAEINAINGPTYLGEPAPTAQPAPAQAAPAAVAWPRVTDAMALAFHSALSDGAIGSDEVEETKAGLRAALAAAPATQPAPQQEPSYTSVQLAEMVLSDCGHSSNYTPLLDRVAARIDAHVERRLDELRGCLESNPAPSPAAQGDALDAARLDFLIEHQAYVVSDDTCCDGYWLRYPLVSGATSVQIGEYETPREAIDAARAAQEGK